MGLEAFSYIAQLVPSNPVNATDDVAQGDDHIRGLKTTLQNTFPNADAAINPTVAEFNRLVGVTGPIEEMRGMAATSQAAPYQIAAGDAGKMVFIVGNGTITLPNLSNGFACLIASDTAQQFTLTSSSGALNWYAGGATFTGNRTVSQGSVISVVRVNGNWVVFGAGIS